MKEKKTSLIAEVEELDKLIRESNVKSGKQFLSESSQATEDIRQIETSVVTGNKYCYSLTSTFK